MTEAKFKPSEEGQCIRVKLSNIHPNPMRAGTVRLIPSKVEALRRSMANGVGVFPGGIIVRQREDGEFEQAFGHNRKEAARLEFGDDAEIDVTLMALDPHKMVQFFGRENLAEFNTDFYSMLEAYLSAKDYLEDNLPAISEKSNKNNALSTLSHNVGEGLQPIDIAKDLGWTRFHTEKNGSVTEVADHTANACAGAAHLIDQGGHTLLFFEDLTVRQVMELVNTEKSLRSKAIKTGKRQKTPAKETTALVKIISQATEMAGQMLKDGDVLEKDVKGEIEKAVKGFKKTGKAPAPPPELLKGVLKLASTVYDVLETDANGKKLDNLETILKGYSPTPEEENAFDKLAVGLDVLSRRAGQWSKTFDATSPLRKKKKSRKKVTQTTQTQPTAGV